MSELECDDKRNTSNCSGVGSPQHWGWAWFNLFHTNWVCRTSFSPSPLTLTDSDDWRSVGARIPWSGSRCHSKGTHPVWSAVKCLSGHRSLWFPGRRENRLSCPKVSMLLMSDNRKYGLTANRFNNNQLCMNCLPCLFTCTCLTAVKNLYNE